MRKTLFVNGRILTQCHGVVADSMAVNRHQIEAVGVGLPYDPALKSYARFDLKGKTIIPGFVDAHTHLYFWAQSLGRVTLQECDSIESCLKRIGEYAQKLPSKAWVIGEGYSPDAFKKKVSPDRSMLDRVTAGRPAFIFSKDEHTAWVNSAALSMAGITSKTPDPVGGRIERESSGGPSGLLREGPAYHPVYRLIPQSGEREMRRLWQQALELAWKRGVTGVHSFDSPEGFSFMEKLAEQRKLGLRINYYPRIEHIGDLERAGVRYGRGDDFLRIAGIKIFVDGALGSQTALCFHKYAGSKTNYGIEVTSKELLARQVRRAARLGFPCAIHAIGDRAVSSVLDVLEKSPRLAPRQRHRIEHIQLIRRRDVSRLKKLHVVASMQPSHCAADVTLVRRFWPDQAANSYLFKSIYDAGIPMAFGSDCPIEPLDPLAGIAAAVRRVPRGSRQRFFPSESLDAARALFAFTAGPVFAAGEENLRGQLLPGYPADFVILPVDPIQVRPDRLYDMPVLATVLNGDLLFADSSLRL